MGVRGQATTAADTGFELRCSPAAASSMAQVTPGQGECVGQPCRRWMAVSLVEPVPGCARRGLWKLIARPSQLAESLHANALWAPRGEGPAAANGPVRRHGPLPLSGCSKSGMDTTASGVYDTGRSPTAA